jgi:general secretion pathway protein D
MKSSSNKLLLITLILCLFAGLPKARGQNDFPEEEFDEPPSARENQNEVPPPPPPPPPPANFGNGNDNNNTAPSFPPSGPSNMPSPGGSSFGTRGRQGPPPPIVGRPNFPSSATTVGRDKKVDLAHAQPEDITDENFPDLVESFDYPNADIKDVIKAMSELTGKNFILDNNVSGKITIIAPTRITVADAYKAFLSALAVNGLTIVPSGKFLKVTNSGQARRNSIETYSGSYYPTSDIMITRIISLKYISAKDLNDRLRQLVTKDGEMNFYEQTNSLIIADYGSNVERMAKIITELDKPGFEEQLEVILLRHAKASNMADIIMQVINKESTGSKNSRFAPRIPRFNQPSTAKGGGAEQLSMVAPDERTNSLIVLGNRAGLDKVKELVKKLDFGLSPEDAGGVFVYYVKYGEAEKIAATLNGVAGDTNKNKTNGQNPNMAPPAFLPPPSDEGTTLFGGEVKVTADKITNSLIVTASKTDYETVKAILAKIDIPRDQVFVEAIIMELSATRTNNWGINYYQFAGATNPTNTTGLPQVVGRSGISANPSTSLADILDPTKGAGAILSFASGQAMTISAPGSSTGVTVTSLLGFVNFLTTSAEGAVLSNPRIIASNNEEAKIEVGQKVPVAPTTTTTGTTVSQGVQFENATIKLVMTPYISPNNDTVRMKLEQTVANVLPASNDTAPDLAKTSQSLATRAINTNISVRSGDTAVLGGLIRTNDSVKITKVPLLGDIPILGWLFKGQSVSHDRTNLVVFITPKILRSLEDGHEILDARINERIDYVKENMRGEDPMGKRIDTLPRRALGDEPPPKIPKSGEKVNGAVEGNTQELIQETLQSF